MTNGKSNDMNFLHDIKDLQHITINFIHDSSNLFSSFDHDILIKYLTIYCVLFYDSNEVTINDDKTELMVSCKNDMRHNVDKICFYADKYKVLQKETTKNFGFTLNDKLNHDSYINILISRVNNRINTFRIV